MSEPSKTVKRTGDNPSQQGGKGARRGNVRREAVQTDGSAAEYYRHIVDTAYEGIWVLDKNYQTVFANMRLGEMLGYSQEEMTGKRHRFFLFDEDIGDLEEKQARRRQGMAEHYERRLRRKDGSTLWCHVSASPILDDGGVFQGSFAMFTDVSELKTAQEALLQSEAKYRSIFEHAVEGIFQSTPEGRLVTVNPSMARIFGYASPEEMLASVTNIGDELYADADERRTFRQRLEDQQTVRGFEATFYRKDGTLLWGSLSVRAVRGQTGEITYYEGTMEDITARKSAEQELKRSEEKYRHIFENAVEGIFQITPDGRYLSVNPALARIHGFASPEEMIASVTDIAHQLYVDPSRRAELTRVLEEKGIVRSFEIMMRRRDGSLHWVSITSHAVTDAAGSIVCYEGTLEDITSSKLAKEESNRLQRVAEGLLHTLTSAVEARDPGIVGHHGRVSKLATLIAEEMGLTNDTKEAIRIAAHIHDLGKLSVPAEILRKPAPLTDMEHSMVKIHPQAGHDLIRDAGLPFPVPEIIRQHHERLNGSGYPQGIRGNAVLLEARILAVADVVEAIAFPRPYRPGRGIDGALSELQKNKGTLYDADVVGVCVKLFKEKGFRFAGVSP